MSNVIHDGKFVIDSKSGARQLDAVHGIAHIHKTDPTGNLCPCGCRNYYSAVCRESGSGSCALTDPLDFGFCRSDYANFCTIYKKPQLYTPDEVKQYYPNWATIPGWNEETDLWLSFLSYYYNGYTYYPPTKAPQEDINYDLDTIIVPNDSPPYVKVLMEDVADCPDYVIYYNPGQCCGSPTRTVTIDPIATSCIGDCRCVFTVKMYEQWMKENNRDKPYYMITASRTSVAGYLYANGLYWAPAGEPNRPGLYSKCGTWNANSKCQISSGGRECLNKCCNKPPKMIAWWAYFKGYMHQSGSASDPQGINDSKSITVGETCSCSVGRGQVPCRRVPMFSILWDNNTTTSIPVAGQPSLPYVTATVAKDETDDTPPTITWSNSYTTGTFTKCCFKYNYAVSITPGDMVWHKFPSSVACDHNRCGYGWFGLPSYLRLQFWTDTATNVDVSDQDPENGMYKVIDQEFPLSLYYGDSNCFWDSASGACLNNSSATHCPCSSCGPFSNQCGTGGGMGGLNSYFSGTYGTACMVARSTNPYDVNVRNYSWENAVLPVFHCLCVGTDYSNCVDARTPACYYKDCLYPFGVDPNPDPDITGLLGAWTERRGNLISSSNTPEATAFMLPTKHGGLCKYSVVDDAGRVCGTCQHPYIRCTHEKSPYGSSSFMPRLCGEGKCIYFEDRTVEG